MAKILVVDDDPEFVSLMRMCLEPLKHQVFSAMDATVGLMLATREKPDLIALDYQLPGGDGVELYKRLQTNTLTAGTKTLFISSMSRYDLEHVLPDDPHVAFLQKPIDPDAFKRLISEMLGGPPPEAPAPRSAPEAKAAPAERTDVSGGAFGGDILDLDLPG